MAKQVPTNTEAKRAFTQDADASNYYTDLAYRIPSDDKGKKIWMGMQIYYAKRNSVLLVDPQVAQEYRNNDRLIIDSDAYRNLIDPASPKDLGNRAAYFAADFQAYPIDVHLDNIVRAALEKIPHNLTVKLADPVAKLQEQKDKEKMIYQHAIRRIINSIAAELGLPNIKDNQDPYKWMEAFVKNGEKGAQEIDTVGNAIDQLRNKIKTDDQLRMFMRYVYKNGLEIAYEAAIQYYFIELNKWHLRQDDFINDLKNFNCFTGMWYIDQTTGRPIVKYLDPSTVYTSPFTEKNGDDLIYWGTEYYTDFATFERMLGSTLDDKAKKLILDTNKLWNNTWGSNVGLGWQEAQKTNAQVKLGFFSVLTQEGDSFTKYYIDNTGTLQKSDNTWEGPNVLNENNPNKTYNVWYSCYYIPLPDSEYSNYVKQTLIGNEGWNWLSQYVFKIEKVVDMARYGVDMRYAKSSLVIYRDYSRPSYSQIKARFMPKITTLWHKIQNCIVQDVNAMAWDTDLMAGLLNAVDDANQKVKGGGDTLVREMKQLKQSGVAWVKFRDKNGNLLVADPSKLFVAVKSGHMESAEKYMLMILSLYSQMTQALAISPASEGQQPDPRTPASGIEISAEATDNARWYLEKPTIELAIMYGERVIQYVNTICKEKDTYNYSKRWDEFVQVVGMANGATIESIENIKFENIGLTVTSENNFWQKKLVIDLATQKAAAGLITTSDLSLIMDTSNWKYQMVEMTIAEDKVKEEKAMEAQASFQQAMALKQQDLQIAQAQQAGKTQGKLAEIDAEGRIEAMLTQLVNQEKFKSQAALQDQRGQLKNQDAVLNAQLDKDKETHRKNLDEQAPTYATPSQ